MARKDNPQGPGPAPPAALGRSLTAAVLALVVPGAGHAWLRRPARAAIFFVLVVTSLAIGCSLDGAPYRIAPRQPLLEQPLAVLTSLATMGSGVPYLVARHGLGYRGDPAAAGYEYGNAFLVTAGLMNLLLVFDAWDIARGRKE